MLIQFRFENFRSFRDDTVLDFSATKIREHDYHVVRIGDEKILPVAGIFGANASGKSNVFKAFKFMCTYVENSFGYGGEDGLLRMAEKNTLYTPFMFDTESRKAESSFEVFFTRDNNEDSCIYNYGFTIGKKRIVEEWLNRRKASSKTQKKIFYRDGEDVNLDGLDSGSAEMIRRSLNKNALIVSLGAMLKIPEATLVKEWFDSAWIIDFGDPAEMTRRGRQLPADFMDGEDARRKVVEYFSSFDPSIIRLIPTEKHTVDGKTYTTVASVHNCTDNMPAEIPLEQESAGTLKMLSMYQALETVLSEGGLLVVDELNSQLHPLLVRKVLLMFLNPEKNKKHAQLLFITHDAWQLSNNLLRRDEIWFTEKDENGVSTLYSLADFVDEDGSKIRKDESYEKNYMLGKYGAIPMMREFNFWEEE